MKSAIIFLILIQFSIINYGQIVADHTVVDKYDKIPQEYIDKVKKMWVSYAGESHAIGVLRGLEVLESINSVYAVSARDYSVGGTPEGYTTIHLRASTATWGDCNNSTGWYYEIGEEDWWTNSTAVSRVKSGLSYCNSTGPALSAIGFGWCWDALTNFESNVPSTSTDPVYGVHWYGMSVGGPSGNKAWGIDNADNTVSGNSINMDTYLAATQAYIDYCTTNSIPTGVFFTTGPVDNWDNAIGPEALYQGYLKDKHVRDYVNANPTRMLFDYADILCYNNSNVLQTATWNGHTFPTIHPDNDRHHSTYTAHIGEDGAVRLAKAMWWMLARMAGWDGVIAGLNEEKYDNGSLVRVETTDSQIRIKLDDTLLPVKVSIYNLQGSIATQQQADSNYLTIPISQLLPGIYLVVVSNAKLTETRKIVVH